MIEFAPANLFCAHAVSTAGDPDLPKGDHLRILAAAEIGPPIAPYAIWQVPNFGEGIHVMSQGGAVAMPPLPNPRCRFLGVDAPREKGPQTVIVRDAEGLELARKSSDPWEVAAPIVHGIETAKPGPLQLMPVDPASFSPGRSKPSLLAMPIEGQCAWYAGGVAVDEAMKRVETGAPRRLTALDRPTGPYTLIPPEAEVARIKADRAGIDELIEALVRDGKTPPAQRSRSLDDAAPGGDPDQSGDQPLAEALLFSTVDYGFARYAGSAVMLPGAPSQKDRQTQLYWVVGLFAIDPQAFTIDVDVPGLKHPVFSGQMLDPLTTDERDMVRLLMKLVPGLQEVVERAQKSGLQIRPLLTAALGYRPPDYLAAPKPQRGAAAWIPAEAGPSTAFRQSFRFPGLPFAATMAMSASSDGATFVSRAEPVDTKADPPATIRHNVILIGRDEGGTAMASDAPIAATDPPPTYRFAVADLFGRYGKSRMIPVPVPNRPPPPTPQPQPVILRAVLPADSTAALSPGTISVTVAVPPVEALGAGARPIATLTIAFNGETRVLPATPPAIHADFALPALAPQASGSWPLTAFFVDDAATVSVTATTAVALTDARPPIAIKAGPGIVWTSRPGPSPEVELALRCPTGSAAGFRAYLADAKGLKVSGASRAAAAFAGCVLQQTGQLPPDARQRFRLLTDPPVPATGGSTRVAVTLPRALSGVSFLKVVPVSAEGVEADFDACDFVPVAVPSDHRPPPPRLTGRIAASGAITLSVKAAGLDLAALAAAEPGLSGPPLGAGAKPPHPPEYRLRRASGAVNDPLYARTVAEGPLAIVADAPAQAEIDAAAAGPLPPFVRCTWWAEVRMPPERRLPIDVIETPLSEGLVAEFAAQMADMPAPYSSLSTPFTTIPAPLGPPTALAESAMAVAVKNASGLAFPIDTRTVTLTIAAPPRSHPAAIGPFRLTVWIDWGSGAPDLAAEVAILADPFVWSETFASKPAPVAIYVMVTDPLGRAGAPTIKAI